jgi:uncharacterized membrane protein
MPEEMKEVKEVKAAAGKASDSNVFAAISYLGFILTGILVYLLKKEDKFARFHAMQSIILGVVLIVVQIIVGIIALVPVIGWIIALLYPLVILIVWLFMMWKAFKGEKYMLPTIGAYAEKYAS